VGVDVDRIAAGGGGRFAAISFAWANGVELPEPGKNDPSRRLGIFSQIKRDGRIRAMTKITITAQRPGSPDTMYAASTDACTSVGRTAGAALDALSEKIGGTYSGAVVVLQNLRADEFFTVAQQQRLEELLTKWRLARDSGHTLPTDEQAELESLVDRELEGSARRVESAASQIRP
jgi:hypothetical protein